MTSAAQPWATVPALAHQIFGDRLSLAVRYAELLATIASERGLIGPRETSRLWDRHLIGGAVLGELVARSASVADIGTGAGLPGVPLLIARPDLHVTLVEPMQRRVDFLELVRRDLGLELHVLRSRAENVTGVRVDVVVARAVAPLEKLVPLALPLLPDGGTIIAVKGAGVHEEIAAATRSLDRHGILLPQVKTLGSPPDTTTVALVEVPELALRSRSTQAARPQQRRPTGPSRPRS